MVHVVKFIFQNKQKTPQGSTRSLVAGRFLKAFTGDSVRYQLTGKLLLAKLWLVKEKTSEATFKTRDIPLC